MPEPMAMAPPARPETATADEAKAAHEAQTPKAEAGAEAKASIETVAEATAPVLTVASFVITVGAFLFTRLPSLYNMSTA